MPNNTYLDFSEDAEPPQWFSVDKAQNFVAKVLEFLHLDNWELSILFCSNSFIKDINKQYRNVDEPTDVLSFALNEKGDFVTGENLPCVTTGDMLISFDAVKENEEFFSVSAKEELKRLIIHGILHIAGHDHKTNDEVEPMLQLQETVLKNIEFDWK